MVKPTSAQPLQEIVLKILFGVRLSLNPRIQAEDFDGLIAAKLDEPVFTTRLSETVTVHNLNRAFNALLDELDLKTGADGRTRTLYSFRHFYATLNLERGVTTHALSRQLGQQH